LNELIDQSGLSGDLRGDLHKLRRYRNRWVHVEAPEDDAAVQSHPEKFDDELATMAAFAARVLRRLLYSDQCV
jgi:hypothetical protein